jgi:RNAse (barnase) inhibitor barstar
LSEFQLESASAEPRVLVSDATIFELDNATFAWRRAGFDVRTLRGPMMRTISDAYREIAAVFQFPLYFGQNLMAVDDLLTDLEWVSVTRGWVIPIAQPESFLIDENARDESFSLFVDVLMGAKKYWAGSIRYNNSPATPHLPFNFVLAGSAQPDDVAREWNRAGVAVVRSTSLPSAGN